MTEFLILIHHYRINNGQHTYKEKYISKKIKLSKIPKTLSSVSSNLQLQRGIGRQKQKLQTPTKLPKSLQLFWKAQNNKIKYNLIKEKDLLFL